MPTLRFLPSLLLVALLIPGCSIITPTPQAQYYLLASPSHDNSTDVRPQGPRIGLLAPELPGYLQRPQMVLRDGDSVDMRVETYNRWGEDLAMGMNRVLTAVITSELASANALALPLRMGVPVDWRIQIAVRRFEGAPGTTATLEASWVLQKDGNVIRDGVFSSTIASGPTISTLVQAQSELLAAFAKILAGRLRPLL